MSKETFAYLNSAFWLKHTHQEYRSPDEIHFRMKDVAKKDWELAKRNLLVNRKVGAIPFFLNSVEKKFWFFPADSILKKAAELEKAGLRLHRQISDNPNFKKEFVFDSTVEEAITSALYEGANSTRAAAQELIASGQKPKTKDDWMLLNTLEAMKWAKANLHREIDFSLFQDIHQIVTRNTLHGDDANFSGRFRNDKVFVRSTHGQIKHQGLPWDKVEAALAETSKLISHHERFFPSVIKGILLHYLTAYIHPFFDGNGRTARTLFYFKSMKNGLDFVELLSLSAYLKNHGRQYEKSFEKVVDNELDMTYFVDFNLNALLKAVDEVDKKVAYLLSLRRLKEFSETATISESQIGLLQRLVLQRFRKVDIEEYAKIIDRSREIARQELKQLATWRLLDEAVAGKKFVYTIHREELARRLGR